MPPHQQRQEMTEVLLVVLRRKLWRSIHNEPGYLLRQSDAGLRAHLVLAWLVHREGQVVQELTFRDEAPAVWLTPRPTRRTAARVEGGPYDDLSISTDKWYCQNVVAVTSVTADLLPEFPHDDQFMVHVAGVLYELA